MEWQIIAGEFMPDCKRYVVRELEALARRGVRAEWVEKPPGVLRCRLVGHKKRLFPEKILLCKWAVARGLGQLVADRWDLLMPALIRPYGLRLEDWGLERIRERVNAAPGVVEELAGIVRRVADYLEEFPVLHLQGFVTFRLPDVAAYLTRAVERVLDALVLEREDAEFVNLLRHVALRRRSLAGTVHVFVARDTRYRFYNENLRPLNPGPGLAPGTEGDPAEDELVAAVIRLAPRAVVLHGARAVPFAARTLKEVFGAAFRECSGCRLCRHSSLR
ncbi:MAG: sporulation protein YtxC [Bacillota bacterium]